MVFMYERVSIMLQIFYPLANEVAMGYINATVRLSFLPSVRNILVNTLESTSFNLVHIKSLRESGTMLIFKGQCHRVKFVTA
jgi:hypothetical protein